MIARITQNRVNCFAIKWGKIAIRGWETQRTTKKGKRRACEKFDGH